MLERINTGSLLSKKLAEDVEDWTGEHTPRVHGTDRRYAGLRLRAVPELDEALREVAKQRFKPWPAE